MRSIILYYPKLNSAEDSQPLYRGLPLSVLTLAAQFADGAYEIRIIDGRLDDNPYDTITGIIDNNCICIGISAITSYQLQDGMNLSKIVKSLYPTLPIIWGGWHPSLMPQQTIQCDFVDIVVLGQGEITFPKLVNCLDNDLPLDDVPNLLYKDQSNNVVSTPIHFMSELDEVKPVECAYKYINMNKYIQALWGNRRVVGFESSRGCPWSCKFCSMGSVYNRKWNALSAEHTYDGVKHLYTNYHIDAVHFYDNNFFVNPHRVQQFSHLLMQGKLPIKWDGTAVVEQFVNFSDDYINRLTRSGFYRVICGVESGDEEVLKRIDKKHCNEQVLQLVEKCKKHGIMVSLSFIIGFPWNPEKDFEATVKLIERIKEIDETAEILLFIFSPYLGTPLYDVALEYGMEFPNSLEGWSRYTYERANTPWISKRLLKKMNRYISFFGTKDISPALISLLQGGKESDSAHR